jgi:hypothetical protein
MRYVEEEKVFYVKRNRKPLPGKGYAIIKKSVKDEKGKEQLLLLEKKYEK